MECLTLLSMLVLTANEDKKLSCITCWEECNTGLFQKIVREWEPEKPIEERNPVLLFSILTGTDFKVTLTAKDDQLESAIYQCIAFVYVQDMFFKSEKAPQIFEWNKKLITIPKDLGSLTIEQNMHLRRALEKANKMEELIAFAMAIYLQPLIDGGEFDLEKAKRLEADIEKMPI